MSTLQIGSDLAVNLPGCEIGDIKTLTLIGTVTAKNPDGSLTLNVTDVSYGADTETEPAYTEEAPEAPRKPTAVSIMIGKAK